MTLVLGTRRNESLGAAYFMRRRDATRVIYEVLLLVREEASKTRIVRHVNLNFAIADRYIGFLLAKELIAKKAADHNAVMYCLTSKGERLFHFLEAVEKELVMLTPVPVRTRSTQHLSQPNGPSL